MLYKRFHEYGYIEQVTSENAILRNNMRVLAIFHVFRSQQGHGKHDNLGAKIKSQEMPQEVHIF